MNRNFTLLLSIVLLSSLLGNCGNNGNTTRDGTQLSDASNTDKNQPDSVAIVDKTPANDTDPSDTDPSDTDPSDTGPSEQPQVDLNPKDQGTVDNAPPTDKAPPSDKAPDAGPVDKGGIDSAPDTRSAPDKGSQNNSVPVFVAQGDIGRTMLSCDDGKTWKANRSWELEGDAAVCGKKAKTECYNLACQYMDKTNCVTKTPCDCDHHPGAPQGMAYGNGWFAGTWGWGPPGSVRRSEDGVKWETVITGTTFGGIDFGGGTFVTGDRSPRVSNDNGKTWQAGGKADLQSPQGTVYNVRQFAFVNVGQPSGRFIVTGESGEKRDLLLSADKGKTWFRPNNLDRACASTRGIAGGKGVIIILANNNIVCRSTDAGKTFVRSSVPETAAGKPIWDGKAFHYWNRGKRFSSPDGKTWTPTALKLSGKANNLNLGAMAYNEKTGTYVAVNGGWNTWYSKQVFYRSTDGVNWIPLAKSAFTASHRIRHIRFGYVIRSAKGCQ